MQTHERDLFISLCLGMTLSGNESANELELILEEASAASPNEIPVLQQEEVANWLQISVLDCATRREASGRLWDKINQRGFSLVDVPVALRRAAFGDEQAHRRRAWAKGRPQRMKAALVAMILRGAIVAAVAGLGWYLLNIYVL